MALQVSGINEWIAGVRYRMEHDPGRQDLEDHILCNGFLFLDEYLEDILMGARTEPIIELTKTPGRRKETSKKARAATKATAKIGPLQFNSPDKENISVMKSPAAVKKAPTSFQKALLKASKENQPHDSEEPPHRMPSPIGAKPQDPLGPGMELHLVEDEEEQEEEAVQTLVTPPLDRIASGINSEQAASSPLPSPSIKHTVGSSADSESDPAASTQEVAIGLSVIAEGDENDMLRADAPISRPVRPVIRDREISFDIPKYPSGPMETVTVAYEPNPDDDDDTQALRPYDRSFDDSEPTSTASSFPIDPYARDYETHELPHFVADYRPEQTEHTRLSHSPAAQSLTRKASIPVLPSLPVPSPFHQSTRESSAGGPVSGNTRSGATAGTGAGTRTSWLNKTRDVTAKHMAGGGMKRKSVELTGEPSSTALADTYARATKVPKTSTEGGVFAALPDKERPQSKTGIQPFRPVVPSRAWEPPVAHVAQIETPPAGSDGMMSILKRTVEGLGLRGGKSMGKSLGGTAATAAAAEAKAAAEARLAQREAKGSDGNRPDRLSVSDLVTRYDNGKGKGKEPELVIDRLPAPAREALPQSRASTSTTPPDSPPLTRNSESLAPAVVSSIYAIPKFTVQRPLPQEQSFALPESQPSTQSTYVSSIFDDHSAWPQSSLTTEYTVSQGFSQPEVPVKDFAPAKEYATLDLSKEVGWTQSQTDIPAVHSQSTDYDAPVAPEHKRSQDESYDRLPGAFDPEEEDMDVVDNVLNDKVREGEEDGRTTSTPSPFSDVVESQSGSDQPSSSNTTQTGFVAQASTLFSKVLGSSVGSALGGSKRGKAEPVKSIQLAAAAAKKQQEEADKKAARLREMDKRRAAIASKKAEQEAAEKTKQRKREREEGPEKKVTRATVKKIEEEVVKKRKVVVEIEKKPESKKPASKDKKELGGSRIGKPTLNASQSQTAHMLSKSFKQPGPPASASQSTVKLVGSSQGEPKSVPALPRAGSSQAKDKATAYVLDDVRQPSQTLHAQMQARVQAQLLQSRQEEPVIPSESIELPDINSEYSNSDDEDRPRTFDPPSWAQSPELRNALQSQSRMNPDEIFGPVRPLHMEEIFKEKKSRFRARTSSANWAGTDELTEEEQVRYAKRMGYLG